uniref:Uncharacterized protein n=1 Tax=Caenorhabditis angaria TaxID=860376 RepID=B6VBS9_9PELO|nr:hypothetical protein Csp3_JD01.004 [Caenorhabditis angaria]
MLVWDGKKTFEFTAQLYNLSVEENSVGSKFARCDNTTKIGVRLPEKDATCKFRVAEVVGEKSSLFKAHARQVGDFVFLRIRYKGDNPLNRELKEFYDMVVKATCKRRDSSNLETTTRVHLRVIDRNDASPVFLGDEEGYEATIDDTIEPFSKVLQVEASDADIGINSAIYFSMLNRSHDFFVEPVTGWIRTLRHVKAGIYELKVKSEDRASRLFYHDENEVQPSWTADVKINVVETTRQTLKIAVEKRKIKYSPQRQLAAIITLQNIPDAQKAHVKVGIEERKNVWFEIVQENEEWKLFSINEIPKNANVTVVAGIDYLKEGIGRRIGNVSATIHIEHLIEHSIEFADKNMKFEIEELAPLGRFIAKINPILENPDDTDLVRFSLKSLNASQKLPIKIGEKSGIIRSDSRIFAERSYEFEIIAKLQGINGKEAVNSASLEILDSNNHAPQWAVKWQRQTPIAISEKSKPGDVLLKVDAQDRDDGENGKIIYKIASETEIPMRIDAESGEIILTGALPRGTNQWNLAVWAVDWGSPMSRASALNLVFYRNGTKQPAKPKPAVIQEGDNKNAPIFESFPEILEVSEDAPIGTIIAKLRATDEDTGYNGFVRYVIHDDSKIADQILSINETSGHVWIASNLTKLLKESQKSADFLLKVTAEDAGNPRKFAEKMLKLRILDVNNHAPQFDQPWYTVRVIEDAQIGKEIIKITAIDFDGAENAKIKYSVVSSFKDSDNIVKIDKISGIVSLAKELDRETQDVISITLMASDYGIPSLSSFVNLTIYVDDVNDNPPICLERVTKTRIPEDYPHGAFVTCLAANDRDLGQNARIRYTIEETEKNPFRIDHHTGCVFIHSPDIPLDFHRQSFYNLSIDVGDNGEQMLSTRCELHIELIDIAQNHLAIEFDDVAKEASVYENSAPGTEVIMIEAKEIADEKRKAENIRYSIIGGDGRPYFSIDDKGIVRTAISLDREFKSAHWLTVEARDAAIDSGKMRGSGSERRRAIVHVFVRVLDRNDHRPQPRQPVYFASVKENSEANVVIVKVEASDLDDIGNDAAPPLQYRIERGDPQSFFRIDLTSGYLTTSGSRKLDREKQAEHELWVSICDGGEPQLCSQVAVIVRIEDENDNAPQFTQPIHHYNVRAKFSGELCRIFAVDLDEGINAEIFYNITEGDSRFSIDENGIIRAVSMIHGDESYALTVQATDRGSPPQFAATRVVLTAIGGRPKKLNNKAPQISGKKADYIIPISDADQVGLTIGKLEAIDEDGDELWWNITGGDNIHNFDVKRDNGQLLLAKKVDNLKRGELRLNISCTDGFETDHTSVIIQVARSPLHRPKFSASHYQTDISEKTAVGTQIYTLKASGEDMGPGTKPLVYSIFSIEDVAMEEKIRVEPSSGNVIIMEPLDFETSRQIRAIVQVRQANFKNFATLIVNVIDENDNAPKFSQSNQIAFVDESDPVGSLVAKVTAFDADNGENGMLTYTIISGNEQKLFELDKLSGEVRLAKPIDRDEHVESILRIRASDSAKYSLSDEMTLHIKNSNSTIDLRVKFHRKIHQFAVFDSTPPGTPLIVLAAQHHGSIRYQIVEPCPYFDVHPLSGAVVLSKWLTRERNEVKSVNCSVRVIGSEGESDEAKIILKIRRTNQYAPRFRQQVYNAQIRENSPIGSPVFAISDNSPLIVNAVDLDNGPNGLVAYRMPEDDYFVVDLISGAIRVRKPIDFERIKEWRFYVNAHDMGSPSRSSLMPALVIVTILDENDEPPKFLEKSITSFPIYLPTANNIRISPIQNAKDIDTVGRIRYTIKDEEAKSVFAINSTNGDVRIIDAEKLKEKIYVFDVFASDGIRTDSYSLNIPVSRPEKSSNFRFISQKYSTTILENTTYPVGKPFLSVTAIGGSSVSYSIINPRDEFAIHSGTGIITSTGIAVDREIEAVIRLVVQARSMEQIAQTTVEIHVEDLNDEIPMFVSLPYDVSVSMDAKIGDEIIVVRAIDKDEGLNGQIKYSSSNIPPQFSIKENGKIQVSQKLNSLEDYTFDVIAEDNGNPKLKSTTTVTLRVVDKAQPVFGQQVYTVTISPENIKKGDLIVKVTAKSNINLDGGIIGFEIVGENENENELFEIDWQNGEIHLKKDPRKLEKDQYIVEIEAIEATKPKLRSRAKVVINLKSNKIEAPVFEKKNYLSHIAESSAIGEKVLEIKAERADSYAIKGEDSSAFSIDSDTGEIRLAKLLDFETKQMYKFVATASDKRQIQTDIDINFIIDDVNDETPKFMSSFSSAQIDDSAIPGQFVTILSVTDLDTVSSLSDNLKLLYKIVDGDETLFDIDSKSGKVTLARLIEEDDVMEKKNLNVSVTDGIFTSYAQLLVDVKKSGTRQLPPRFEQSQYVASALENTPVNKSVLIRVNARDGITPIHYSLGPASSSGGSKGAWPVRIDKITGRIHVSRVLNYHNDKIYQIPLVAEDAVGRRAFATLTLSVIDINDKPPVFVLSSYSCSMSALAKEGDTVLMVSATDDDEGDSIEYSLLDDSSVFSVHPKQGTVTVAKKLEDKVGNSFSLIVKATDSANPPHHATTTVEIQVAKKDTPVPRFSNSHYLFSVSEDASIGSVIGRVQQVNQEIEEVRFSIAEAADSLPFSVERGSGKIVVKSELDRERKSEWRMAIKVEAAGHVHSITTVTIDVADVNDNAPAFQGDYERLTISEDSPIGTSVAIFSATDRDDSPSKSGTIRFSLVEEISQFVMNPESGWLTVSSSLDREKIGKYDLIARATDEGGLNTDLKFSVIVNDVNDSPPQFSKSKYEVWIDSNPQDNFLTNIEIIDLDLPPFNISKVFISSGNEEGIFSIDENNNITIKRAELIGLSQKSEYILELTAFDGVFARNCEVVVKIRKDAEVQCENQDGVSKLQVKENSKKGTVVIGESMNSKKDYVFSIKEENPIPFVINFRNGIVKVKENVDFEKEQMFEITRVMMNKKKEIICEEKFMIDVIDENDNPPKIISPKVQNLTIKENLAASLEDRILLTRIIAKDLDLDSSSILEYRLKNSFDERFLIEPKSGVLMVVKMLDREEIGEYRLDIVVSDGKFEDSAIVNVIVADQNDNPPIFERKVYSMKVMESESIGYELVKVRADGGDSGESVTYSLKPSKMNKMVKLDPNSGILKLAEGLDFEKLQKIEIFIEAKDSGNPPLTAETKIEIEVMDENDNVPIFKNTTYFATVLEHSKNGTEILKVEAEDKDSEHFGRIVYSIKNQTEIPFVISKDGVISVNGNLDYEIEEMRKYRLKIEAKDGGGLKSEVDVDIEIEDINDNSPIFEDCNMTAVIQESANINSIVLSINVKDLDGPMNSGPFKFEIKGDGAKVFKIEGSNLMTAARLQHSKKDRYLLTVIAKDLKGKSTDCPLTIWVKEESRHAPIMKPLKIRVNTLQSELVAGNIGRLRASDQDEEDLLRYSIVEDSIRGPLPTIDTPRPNGKIHNFRIDANSGDIWSDHSISDGLHSFNVTVTDGKFKTISYVEIYVLSIDSDTIEHSVAIRIRSMDINEFMKRFEAKFRNVIGAHLNINAENIQLISLQEVEGNGRAKRASEKDIEILFTAQRGPGRGFLKPDHVYSRLKLDFQNIQDKSDGMRYQLITEMCTPGVCRKGECRERIELLEDKWTRSTSENVGFVSPYHTRDAQCLCPDGLGGIRCEKEINQCSRSPCESYQLCIPSTSSNSFECVCPLGMEGDRCEKPSCTNDGKCLEEAELSVGGDGYFEMSLSNEIESRMELEIELRTTSTNGVVMWSGASHDYHMLAISDGFIEYSWDAGSGQGIVRSKILIGDGKWHRIGISRRQRRTRLVVDDSDIQEAFSPIGSTVINLHNYAQKLVFGAKVEDLNLEGEKKISHGVSACFKTISVDGRKVPKTRQGLRLFGAAPGCLALTSSPCSEMPCGNGGSCVVQGKSFECICPMRYSGDKCQIDLEPCSSNPCPTGIQCIPYHNEYLCKCPNGFTGKHCESRGFDEFEPSCSGNKCGNGQCISIPRQNPESSDFICNCTGGILQSSPCQESATVTILELLLKFEIIMIILGIAFLLIIACCVFLVCRCCKKTSDPKYGAHCDVPHMRNTRVLMPVVDPPPLPPRGFRQNDVFTNTTQNNTNRPMVQVRPFSNAIPQAPSSRHDSRSPSVCGSSKGTRRDLMKHQSSVDFGMSNRARMSDRRGENRPMNDALTNLRDCEDWRTSLDENINAAIRSGVEGRLIVGTTELTPVVNDDDYMTMKPRKDQKFEKQEAAPRVPAHAAPPPSILNSVPPMDKSVLYDDPISMDSQSCTIDDIDNDSDIEEVRIHIS